MSSPSRPSPRRPQQFERLPAMDGISLGLHPNLALDFRAKDPEQFPPCFKACGPSRA